MHSESHVGYASSSIADVDTSKLRLRADTASAGIEAIGVEQFLSSIGVCTHIGQGVDDPVRTR